jgi:hypothetical protein
MKPKRVAAIVLALLVCVAPALSAQQPVISEKQDIAVFALGYYGWNIPAQVLGSIDLEIQKVFSDLGRFTIVGVSQRLSSGGLEQFIATVKKAKQVNFVTPEKYQFGEAFLTEAEFNRLVGSFFVVAPVVTEFNSFYNTKTLQYETSIKTSVTFIDVAGGGTVVAIKNISSSGSDKSNQYKSMTSAISAIPGRLDYEVRSIPQFQISTRVLAADGSNIKMQMGNNMGIRKGDEFAVIQKDQIEGFDNSKEAGLVVIKEVGSEVSTGQVLYTSIRLGKDTQLREIARVGTDLDLFLHSADGTLIPGLRAVASRGFYGFRPYLGVQMPLGQAWSFFTVSVIPVTVVLGGEYNMMMGRLAFSPYAGVSATYLHVSEAISGLNYDTEFLSHIGAQAYARVSYLFNRNMKAFADLGFEYMLAIPAFALFKDVSGVSIGAGVTFKL